MKNLVGRLGGEVRRLAHDNEVGWSEQGEVLKVTNRKWHQDLGTRRQHLVEAVYPARREAERRRRKWVAAEMFRKIEGARLAGGVHKRLQPSVCRNKGEPVSKREFRRVWPRRR